MKHITPKDAGRGRQRYGCRASCLGNARKQLSPFAPRKSALSRSERRQLDDLFSRSAFLEAQPRTFPPLGILKWRVFGWDGWHPLPKNDPCRLVRQVSEILWLDRFRRVIRPLPPCVAGESDSRAFKELVGHDPLFGAASCRI